VAFTLRPYQQRVVDLTLQHLQDYPQSQPLIVAPCAAGKSVIIADLCVELSKRNSGMVLVMTHRKELVMQTAGKLPDHMRVGVFSAGAGRRELKRITVAGFQSIRKHAAKLPTVASIIIDECFVGETLINTEFGPLQIETLANMRTPPRTACFDEAAGTVKFDKPLRVWCNGIKPVSLLTHSEGKVTCTPTHKFYSNGSWVPADQLKCGEMLRVLDLSSGFLKRLLRASAAVVRSLFPAT